MYITYVYIWFIRIRMHTITYWFDVRSGWSLPIVRWIRLSRKLAPTDGHSWHPRHTGPWQRMRRMGIACIPGHDFLGTQWKRMPSSSKCFFTAHGAQLLRGWYTTCKTWRACCALHGFSFNVDCRLFPVTSSHFAHLVGSANAFSFLSLSAQDILRYGHLE